MKKTIFLSNHEVSAFDKDAEQLWSDTYLIWRGKPGRKKYYAGPTYVSYSSLVNELAVNDEIFHDENTKPSLQMYVLSESSMMINIKQRLDEGEKYVIRIDETKTMPIIYTSREMLNRKEIEQMTAYWLANHMGIKRVKFKWKKRDKDDYPIINS